MALKTAWAVLLFVGAPTLGFAQSQAELRSQLVGGMVTLRGFYSSNNLNYDSSGQLETRSDSGPWTLFGKIEITDLKISNHRLKIEGNRVWVSWTREGSQTQIHYGRSPRRISIEVALNGNGPDADAASAIQKIFLKEGEMCEAAPELWKAFFCPKPSPATTDEKTSVEAAGSSQPDPATGITKVRLSGGIVEGHITHEVQPEYPPLARANRLQGRVLLAAVIGKDGHITQLHVIEPLGMGVDESTAEAVSKWRYSPYLLFGKPVEIDTTITVNYQLH